MRDRVYDLEEARVGYEPPAPPPLSPQVHRDITRRITSSPPRRRRAPRATARRLPHDPPWLHASGQTRRVRLSTGEVVDAFTIEVMCRAVARSPCTVRRLEGGPVVPLAYARRPHEHPACRTRLYTREQILTAHNAAVVAGWFDGWPRHGR